MTAYEVERKYRTDHDPIRRALDERGFRPDEVVEQTDRYLGHPLRPFAVTDEALRLRMSDIDGAATTCELTYKGPVVSTRSKTRRELTVTVDDAAVMESLLAAIGFDPVATVSKVRERFIADGVTVALDTVTGLGTFVEVEMVTDASAVDQAENELDEVANDLGLPMSALVEDSYLELLLED